MYEHEPLLLFMKNLFLYLLCFLITSFSWSQKYQDMIDSGEFTLSEIQKVADAYFETHDTGKGSGYKQYKRWEYQAQLSIDENGYVRSDTYYFDELKRYNSYRNKTKKNATNDNWKELGPTYYNRTSGWNPGIGRVQGFAVDNSNRDHIIIGSGTGGIWKTTDEGKNWVSLTDNFNNLRVYALTMDQKNTNTYYWGSSSGRIYKSIDGGATWFVVGNAGSNSINKILIHPTNSNILFASSNGSRGNGYGIYKSVDGGENWSRKVAAASSYDIEFKPDNPNVVYASGNSVYRSIDGGENFNTIGSDTFSSSTKMLGVTAANPDKIYVVQRFKSAFGGFFVSNDGGDTFVEKNHDGKNYFNYSSSAEDDGRGQAPRDMDIVVSPTNEDEVHIAGILTWVSVDGGTSFKITSQWQPGSAKRQNIGYCHSDIDIMEYVGDKLYVGSDGGISIADKPTTITSEYFRDITEGVGIRDFYKLGVSQTNPVVITAGAQDNGTSTYTESRGWTDWLGADGMESFVDKNNTEILYGTSQNGSLYKTLNQGRRLTSIRKPDNKKGNWITPFEQDPLIDNTIYSGYDQVYKSTNGGSSWQAISQVFAKKLNHLKIAPSDNKVMYAAYLGKLFIENNGDNSWVEIRDFSEDVNRNYINYIAVHPKNANKIAIATNNGSKVYISEDAGRNWVSFKKNLPNFTPYSLVWHDNDLDGLYVGMSYGIYYIDNTLQEWVNFNNKLPNVQVREMEINYADGQIYAATYGRGIWSSPVYDNKNTLTINENQQKLEAGISVYPNPGNDNIFVNWTENSKSELRLFDNQGRIVYYERQASLTTPFEINTSAFASGIYYLRINSDKGEFTKKIILQ